MRNLREHRGIQGRLIYICRFISNLSGHCLLVSLRRYQWLTHLAFSVHSLHLRQTIVAVHQDNKSFPQHTARTKERCRIRASYLLSDSYNDQCWIPIHPMEKECLIIVFSIPKMWHYFVGKTMSSPSLIHSGYSLKSQEISAHDCQSRPYTFHNMI